MNQPHWHARAVAWLMTAIFLAVGVWCIIVGALRLRSARHDPGSFSVKINLGAAGETSQPFAQAQSAGDARMLIDFTPHFPSNAALWSALEGLDARVRIQTESGATIADLPIQQVWGAWGDHTDAGLRHRVILHAPSLPPGRYQYIVAVRQPAKGLAGHSQLLIRQHLASLNRQRHAAFRIMWGSLATLVGIAAIALLTITARHHRAQVQRHAGSSA